VTIVTVALAALTITGCWCLTPLLRRRRVHRGAHHAPHR
jgi:hypothetical protein